MSKNLSRPGRAHTPSGIIEEILGVKAPSAAPAVLPLAQLTVEPGFNPRTAHLTQEEREALFSPESLGDLVRSMQEVLEDGQPRGVQQPLLVRPLGGEQYAVVAGERRYRAAQLAGLSTVPVLVRNLTDQEALAAAIIENAQRQNVDQVSEALAGFRLLGVLTGMDEPQLVRHLNAIRQNEEEDRHGLDRTLRTVFGTGVSTWSQQRAKVLQLLSEERRAIQVGLLRAKSVFPLLKLGDNHAARLNLLQELLAMKEKPSSRDTEQLVERYLQNPLPHPDRAARLRPLLPRLKKLTGTQAEEADRLIAQLQALLD
ncbi:ParB/RepB/Spo0J family partition protein [Deinococcus aluminii]|uniref:Nucleoid occlusion protein n=1 Tax=Deinococcus aluminii TaxID=1656885 RepID=A0ABP9XEQ8_9DEIO